MFHHGAGHSAATFFTLISKMNSSVLLYDARGHGATTAEGQLCLDSLSKDFISIYNHFYPSGRLHTILVGHSLGGAVVVDAALKFDLLGVSIFGVVMIDIVEETALESLEQMEKVLLKIPKEFDSIDQAVTWTMESNLLRNHNSALISVPEQLTEKNGKFYWRTNLNETKQAWFTWFNNLSFKFLSCKCVKLLILAGNDRLDRNLLVGQMQGLMD